MSESLFLLIAKGTVVLVMSAAISLGLLGWPIYAWLVWGVGLVAPLLYLLWLRGR